LGNTAGLHLSGIIGTARHPDMQKIRIIEFFFENSLHLGVWSGEEILYMPNEFWEIQQDSIYPD